MNAPTYREMFLSTHFGFLAEGRPTVLTSCAGLSWKSEQEGNHPLEALNDVPHGELQARLRSLQECVRDLLIRNQELRAALVAARTNEAEAGDGCYV